MLLDMVFADRKLTSACSLIAFRDTYFISNSYSSKDHFAKHTYDTSFGIKYLRALEFRVRESKQSRNFYKAKIKAKQTFSMGV